MDICKPHTSCLYVILQMPFAIKQFQFFMYIIQFRELIALLISIIQLQFAHSCLYILYSVGMIHVIKFKSCFIKKHSQHAA